MRRAISLCPASGAERNELQLFSLTEEKQWPFWTMRGSVWAESLHHPLSLALATSDNNGYAAALCSAQTLAPRSKKISELIFFSLVARASHTRALYDIPPLRH